MVSAGMQLVKYLLFIFNFIFWVSGVAILVVGVLVQVNYKQYLGFVGSHFISAPILLIVVGCIVTIIAFFGCCGAIKENHCMIVTFAVLLGVIFVLELAAGIAAYVLRNDLKKTIDDSMKDGLEHYGWENYTALTKTWDAVQHDFKCCGMYSPNDWNNGTEAPFKPDNYPDSCCKSEVTGCGKKHEEIFHDGCLDKFYNLSEKRVYQVGAVGLGIAFIQIIGIIFACCLASAIKREYEVV